MLHINSLGKYNEAEPDDQPAEVVNVVLNDDFDPRAEALGEAADTTAPLDTGQLRFGEQLTAEQRAEMEDLLCGYSYVLTDRIGLRSLYNTRLRSQMRRHVFNRVTEYRKH